MMDVQHLKDRSRTYADDVTCIIMWSAEAQLSFGRRVYGANDDTVPVAVICDELMRRLGLTNQPVGTTTVGDSVYHVDSRLNY